MSYDILLTKLINLLIVQILINFPQLIQKLMQTDRLI